MEPFTLMLIGTAVNIAGKFASNFANSRQQAINEKYYRDQARFAVLAEKRKQQLAEFDYTAKMGDQISKYASGGVALEGSAAMTVGGTVANFINEAFAIKEEGELNFRLAQLRGNQAGDMSRMLASPAYNLLGAATTTFNSGVLDSSGAGKAALFPNGAGTDTLVPDYTIANMNAGTLGGTYA